MILLLLGGLMLYLVRRNILEKNITCPLCRAQEHIEDALKDPLIKKVADVIGLTTKGVSVTTNAIVIDAIVKQANIAQGKVKAGNYEGAAKIFESLGLFDEAKELRDKARIKRNVTVDVNELIEQVRRGGLTVNYTCQACGAPLTIDSKVKAEGLRYCSYCGGVVDTDLLARTIQSAIG